MSTSVFERYLDQVEQGLDTAAEALLGGNPSDIYDSCIAFQVLTVSFLQMSDDMGRDSLTAGNVASRIRVLAERLTPLMEALLQQSAYVSQALKIVVPTENWSTYNAKLGPNSSSQYGTAMRQSGTFKYLAA